MKEKFILYSDKAFKYTGVWQENGDGEIVSYHTSAQLEFAFTGNSVKLSAVVTGNGFVTCLLDGVQIEPQTDKDSITVSAVGDSHMLKLIAECHSQIYFRGITVSEDTSVYRTPDRTYIQFIGDSITDACPGFATAAAKELGADYSIVSLCGIALTDGWGWYEPPAGAERRYGMESMYFGLETPSNTVSLTEYKFEYCRIPDAFVIFLGTNDYITCQEHKDAGNLDVFADKYFNFITRLRTHFPERPIFILHDIHKNEFGSAAIEKAYALVSAAHKEVFLVDSDKWNVELSSDGVHPNDSGYSTMAKKTAAFLQLYLLKDLY